MKTKLVIIRGNSGSGKTTIAKNLQQHFGAATLLVSQDTVRRDMLMVRDREGNLSVELIRQIAEYGKGKCELVIVEGIFVKHRYEQMLRDLIQFYEEEAHVYYFDLPFEKTVERHQLRPQAEAFGEEALRKWWRPKDFLGVSREKTLTTDMSKDDVLRIICQHVKEKSVVTE